MIRRAFSILILLIASNCLAEPIACDAVAPITDVSGIYQTASGDVAIRFVIDSEGEDRDPDPGRGEYLFSDGEYGFRVEIPGFEVFDSSVVLVVVFDDTFPGEVDGLQIGINDGSTLYTLNISALNTTTFDNTTLPTVAQLNQFADELTPIFNVRESNPDDFLLAFPAEMTCAFLDTLFSDGFES